MGNILTEPVPALPGPQPRPGGWVVGGVMGDPALLAAGVGQSAGAVMFGPARTVPAADSGLSQGGTVSAQRSAQRSAPVTGRAGGDW